MRVYSLKALARHENVTHEHLRLVIRKFKSGQVDHWRDYRFFGIEGKCWFAYPKDKKLEFIDVEESAD